ncbi:hypothetical protein G9A89_002153 [Geosiphon pyriformis]|nr:hypothetical protein G9A89_002153 [Geosiphon pyriformis]
MILGLYADVSAETRFGQALKVNFFIVKAVNFSTFVVLGIILQKTSTNSNHPKVAEPENIGANHLGFAKSLFQQYSQQLGLNNNYFPVESVFNFYVNNKITDCLRETVNIESTKENFYTELFQHTSLPRNYSFTLIIKEINQTIEKYTQQQFPITYADKGKGKLQTPAKKTRVESPTNPSYYYTPESAINISSADASTLNMTSIFGRFLFQSKQRKEDLLGPYGVYFKGFKLQLPMPSGLRSLPLQPDFGTTSFWEITKLEGEQKEEEKKFKDQEFTYQNLIPENPEIETPNFQTQQNLNLENPEIRTPNI